jgi:hypothetical protein
MYEKLKEEFPGEPITSSGTTGKGGAFRKSLKQRGIVATTTPGPFDNLLARYGGLPHLLEAIGMDDERLDEKGLWDEVKWSYDQQQSKVRNYFEFPMTLYRMVRLEGGIGSFRTEDAGVYWALNEKDAEDYWAFGLMGPDAESWIVKAQVSEHAVDWELTLLHDILYEEERQVILKEGAPVQVLGVKKGGDKKWVKPPWKSITASESIVAKTEGAPIDYAMITSVLTELMANVKPGLPLPDLKISNHTKPTWLGTCGWKTGSPNTVITLQKSGCFDRQMVERTLAHELCHHEEFLDYWVPLGLYGEALKFRMKLEGAHGPIWHKIAQRWNDKFGKAFVTVKSDQRDRDVEQHDEKEFYVFLNNYNGGKQKLWQWGIHLSPQQRKYLDFPQYRTPEYKLVTTTDRRFLSGRSNLGHLKGWFVARTPEVMAKWEALWAQEDVRAGWPDPVKEAEKARLHDEHVKRNHELFELDKANRGPHGEKLSSVTAAGKPVRTPELMNWFGQSKVVDKQGKPLVVYHGSKSPWVSTFDMGMEGRGVVRNERAGTIWFTSNKDNAGFFADYAPKKKADEGSIQTYGNTGRFYAAIFTAQEENLFQVGPYETKERAENEGRNQARMYNKRLGKDTHVMAVYLKIDNPLVLDGVIPCKPEFEKARQGGHDGVIARGVVDGSHVSDVYVVFNPNQIKSADRNTGAFDPTDLTITASISKTAFIRDDLIWLKNYLTMTEAQQGEELARNFVQHFIEFLNEEEQNGNLEGIVEEGGFKAFTEGIDNHQDSEWGKIPPDMFERFLEECGPTISQDDPAYAPSFLHMSFEKIVRNQWLVHKTDDPDGIAYSGFTQGIGELDHLGLTTYFTDAAKKEGGYNFAFPANNTPGNIDKAYGSQAVMFTASGVQVYHYGDEEHQVIFWGRDARNIVPIYYDGIWSLPGGSSGRPLFSSEKIDDVIDWVMKNFNQYSKLLVVNPKSHINKPLRGMAQTADSHKLTPLSDNEFPDLAEGEALQGYADMPEVIEGNRVGLGMDQLNEQVKMATIIGYLYHVTYFNRLEDIIWLGLEPNHPASIGVNHGWHTKDKNFLTEWKGVGFWYMRAVQWAYHHSDNPVEDGLTPVVLRTKEYKRLNTQDDYEGTDDAGAPAAFTEKSIPAKRLEVWNGHQWARLTEDTVAAMTPEGYDAPGEDEWIEDDSKESKERYIDENTLYPKTAASTLDKMPSWDEFVKREGGIAKLVNYMGTNWDRFEPDDREATQEFDALPDAEKEKVLEQNAYWELGQMYNDILDRHMSWTYPLTIYRAMTLVDIKDMKTKGVGVCWTWDEDSAEAHYGKFAPEYVKYTLKVQVQEGDINWEGTIRLNLDPDIGESEKEIRLKKGCHPLLLAWRRNEEEWQVPLRQWRSITASGDNDDK